MKAIMRVVLLFVGLLSTYANATQSGGDIRDMGSMVRPIMTTLYFADGAFQQNRGNGFIVGDLFFTAYHNIHTDRAVVEKVVELGGVAVQPSLVDREHDLALFKVPPQLCAKWCNKDQLSDLPAGAQVIWVDDVDDITNEQAWRSGNVRNQAFKSAVDDGLPVGCEHDLVVEVDVPFYPGNSGGPVFDLQSGSIVGLIQGSFERPGGMTTGYYKPVECVLEWFGGEPL
jgi:S1-C subfamily serine protease